MRRELACAFLLLIRTPSGSGKSTFTTELELHIETTHRERCAKELVLVKINLPTLQNPLSDLVHESLVQMGFRDAQIAELRDLARKGEVELIFLLDAYDELKEEARSRRPGEITSAQTLHTGARR